MGRDAARDAADRNAEKARHSEEVLQPLRDLLHMHHKARGLGSRE